MVCACFQDTEAVTDVCWSPFDSCVFASCLFNGKIEVYDLANNKKDPFISHKVEDERSVTSITFAPNALSLLATLDNGDINVYRLNGLTPPKKLTESQQIEKLNASLKSES